MVRSRAPSPEHSIELTTGGDLVYSIQRPGGIERLLLTFEVDGYQLVTNQLAAPEEERVPAVLTLDGELVIGEGATEVRYTRATACLDPDAILLALANRALRESVTRATGEPFLESLWWCEANRWQLYRFVGSTPDSVHAAARDHARSLPATVEACGFVFDGFSTIEGTRRDTAFCRTSRRRPGRRLLVALPYVPGPHGVVIDRLHIEEESDSWLP